jgi:hypothetical protein
MTTKKSSIRLRRSESFLGVHFDLHGGPDCTEVGRHVTRKMLREMLDLVQPDYVQCDCKGHPGLASYPTQIGTQCPGFVRDQLKIWREMTAERAVSLYMHYSGVIDIAAVKKHPSWASRDVDGKADKGGATSVFGPYVDKLMLPMLKELVDQYDVDGVWVDGECWGLTLDYSRHAQREWYKATGLRCIPQKPGDKNYERFRDFMRDGFRKYLAHYVAEMHRYKPGFEIASNWAYSGHMPEAVTIDVDFISGDFTPQNAFNSARLEARIMAGQGKPWDLMAWSFNSRWAERGRSTKTSVQLQQEAAAVLSAGGGFQAYFKQKRDGSIFPWTMKLMAETAAFCRERQAYCHRAESVPQVGLILSTDAYYKQAEGLLCPWGGVYTPLEGILSNLLDGQNSIDVLMEHQLPGLIDQYPLLVYPEWRVLKPALKRMLLDYVKRGGCLLAIGPEATRHFKKELKVSFKGKAAERPGYIESDGWMGGALTLMQNVVPARGARIHAWIYEQDEAAGDRIPAATIARLGKGTIAGVYMNMGERYVRARTAAARKFLNGLVRTLVPKPIVEVTGSSYVDVAVARKNDKLMINLVNTFGPHANENVYTFDEIPPLGPLEVEIQLRTKPASIKLQPGNRRVRWEYESGAALARIPRVGIHDILEVTHEIERC